MPELFSKVIKPAKKRYQTWNERNLSVTIPDQTVTRHLRKLTPMVMNTTNSVFQPWVEGTTGNGLDKIVAFLVSGPNEGEYDQEGDIAYDVPVQQISGEATSGVVMLAGIIHFDDLEYEYINVANTEVALKAALAANPLVDRFQIQGLEAQNWIG